jgi:hypothetical protein
VTATATDEQIELVVAVGIRNRHRCRSKSTRTVSHRSLKRAVAIAQEDGNSAVGSAAARAIESEQQVELAVPVDVGDR